MSAVSKDVSAARAAKDQRRNNLPFSREPKASARLRLAAKRGRYSAVGPKSQAARSFGCGWTALLLAAALLGWGCQAKPKAPALLDEPVYQSAEGFRFLVPEGWIMSARANIPPGAVEKERLLVQYRRARADKQATLEVSRMDLPQETDLTAYLSGPSFSVRHWQPSADIEEVEAGGVHGRRFRFTARLSGAEMTKEVTAFRRDERVYFFTALFSAKDASAAEQVRHAIARLVWTK